MNTVLFLLILVVILFAIAFFLSFYLRRAQRQLEAMTFQYQSANVKHGKRWEQFAPFMDSFSQVADREKFVFIGMPIDGICFDDDAIKFMEFKTGKSQLSKKQQQIKEQVAQKKVQWIELRF